MYRKQPHQATTIELNESVEGETIEQKIDRIVNNNEPITDSAPIIYTERSEGVLAGYNIRTDRFDVAIDAMDKIASTKIAKREENIIEMKKQTDGNSEGETGKSGGEKQ